MFDLNYYQINLASGSEKSVLPGIFAFTAPKRAARGRETDKLIGYLKISDSGTLSADILQQWIKEAAAVFYRTPGTVTAAMRMVTDYLNGQIMDRNLHGNETGESQVVGSLNLAVEHRNLLYFTTLGFTRSFMVHSQEVIVAESESAARGLGVSRTLIPRFQQSDLADGDLILFSTNPPASWSPESLAGSTTLTVDALRRRLFNQVGSDLQAGVFQFLEGNGKVEQKTFRPLTPGSAEGARINPVKETSANSEPVDNSGVETASSSVVLSGDLPKGSATRLVRSEHLAANDAPGTANINEVESAAQTAAPLGSPNRIASPVPDQISRPKVEPSGAQRESTRTVPPVKPVQKESAIQSGVNQAGEFVKSLLAKVLQHFVPRDTNGAPRLSRSVMLIISIAVPLIVVAIGATVYNQMGRTQEIAAYLGQAQLSVTQADSQSGDAAAQLSSLQQAMFWLEKAEEAGQSEEVSLLKSQVQVRLDSMNGILRLQLSNALAEGLPEETQISHLLTVGTDLYALDGTSGKALRFIQTGGVYQRDVNFDCGPNSNLASGGMGPLVDIVPLETNAQFGATILGIDASGNLEYCIPSDTGNITRLSLPDAGWGNIRAMALSQGTLYVLDTKGNAVYLYEGSGSDFPDKPVLFFDNQVPALSEALDIAVNGDELYILRSNGEMVECTYSYLKALKATECQDPAQYGDMRTGQTPQITTFPGTQFTQLEITDAPDSSLYMLDTIGKTLYHFSLQRNLQEVFNPTLAEGLDINRTAPTAFAVSNGRIVYLAFGNEIQYVQLP